MKNILLRVMVLLAVLCLGTSASYSCSYPPAESTSLTWPHSAYVQVIPDSQVNTSSAVTNAVNNWNNATFVYCFAPTFIFGPSTLTQTVAYGPIATNPNGTPRRGINIIATSGRITSAQMTINSNIPLTFPNVMTEVVAHEIGHTMGLNDCIYSPSCPLYSTVMEDQAPVPTWTGTMGQPGPTTCDLGIMTTVALDYLCPPPGSNCPSPQGQPPAGCSNPVWNTATCIWTCSGSPIIIDISGQGFYLTSAASGVSFDISGTGTPIQMGWTAPGANNAFLALPGADGLVHNGKQLFGNFTPQPKSATPNGFAALAVYDDPKNGGNGDGVIDAKDAIFSSLRLWVDSNHDGISQPEEMHTLPELGVTSISLDYYEDRRRDEYGNLFHYRAKVNPDDTDPSHVGRIAYDVFFVIQSSSASAKSIVPAGAKCQVPAIKTGMLAPVGGSR